MLMVVFRGGGVDNLLLSRAKGRKGGWIVITAGWACRVTIAVYAVNVLNGVHLNPAVTIGLASTGKFEWARVPGYIIAQTAGGLLVGVLVWLTFFRTGRSPRTKARSWPSSARAHRARAVGQSAERGDRDEALVIEVFSVLTPKNLVPTRASRPRSRHCSSASSCSRSGCRTADRPAT